MLLKKVPLEYFKQILLGIEKRHWFKFDAIGVKKRLFPRGSWSITEILSF